MAPDVVVEWEGDEGLANGHVDHIIEEADELPSVWQRFMRDEEVAGVEGSWRVVRVRNCPGGEPGEGDTFVEVPSLRLYPDLVLHCCVGGEIVPCFVYSGASRSAELNKVLVSLLDSWSQGTESLISRSFTLHSQSLA